MTDMPADTTFTLLPFARTIESPQTVHAAPVLDGLFRPPRG
jgi:hypothetical protein